MWLQFVSAATGIAALAALARGLAGRKDMGNFFVDLQRATFLVLLPMALVVASLMVIGGMPMTFGWRRASDDSGRHRADHRARARRGVSDDQAARHQRRRLFRTELHASVREPNFWTNALSMISIILIPMACVWMFGRIVGRMRHAAVVFGVMLVLLLTKIIVARSGSKRPPRRLLPSCRSSRTSATSKARNCASAPPKAAGRYGRC